MIEPSTQPADASPTCAIECPRNVILCGTEQPDGSSHRLRAGPVTVEIDQGQIRYVRVGEEEAVRAIAFVVRDVEWGTYTPEISDLRLEKSENRFHLRYEARCHDARQTLQYAASIRGERDGSLLFEAEVEAETDFFTGRTGFVVLHPGSQLAGRALKVTHTNGETETTAFPTFISPSQPVFDIRKLSHPLLSGQWVELEMEGDAFEMEDQRNWGDCSFKTYIRPLWRPREYVLHAGSRHAQHVRLQLKEAGGRLSRPAKRSQSAAEVTVAWRGDTAGTMPRMAVGVAAEEVDHVLARLTEVRTLAPRTLLHQIVMPRGHGVAELRAHRQLSEALGAQAQLEAVIAGTRSPDEEVGEIARATSEAGFVPSSISIFPVSDLVSRQPGEEDRSVPPAAEIAAAARRFFPAARLGGGMYTYFTELNRKRSPAACVDFVVHSFCPIVHAADDRSVMETLETLPAIVATVRSFIGEVPYFFGPSAIGARTNPYGRTLIDNTYNRRVCLTRDDPRQRGLFGAAWLVGYVAGLAALGIEAVTTAALVGPLGFIHAEHGAAVPPFDAEGGTGPRLYPAFHVLADMIRASGAVRLPVSSSRPGTVAATGWRVADRTVLWFANLTPHEVALTVEGGPCAARLAILDATTFAHLTVDAAAVARIVRPYDWSPIRLDGYASARIELPSGAS